MDIKKEIMAILRDDALTPHSQIARMLSITEEEVSGIIGELEKERIILKYEALINTEALGEDAPAEAMIEIKVEPKLDFGYEDIARRIYEFPEVRSLYLMSGRYDFSIRVEAKTIKEISKFVWEKLAVLEGVRSTETTFLMRKYKENGALMKKETKQSRLVVSP